MALAPRVVPLRGGRIGIAFEDGYMILTMRQAAELAVQLLRRVRW